MDLPSIYHYLDYRKYLRDLVAARRAQSAAFSLEALGRRTGCLSKAHLSLIMAGKRNLNGLRIDALGRALGLSEAELRYYRHLIHFTQAKADSDREQHLRALTAEVKRQAGANLPLDSYRVLETWHCLVIRELARFADFDPRPQALASRLLGLLSVHEAKAAVKTLVETKLLVSDQDGRLVPSAETLRTTDEISSLAIRNYHKSCLELGQRVLATAPVEEREFGSINLVISADDVAKLKELLKSVRDQVLALAAATPGQDARVCQINIQMLNLSK